MDAIRDLVEATIDFEGQKLTSKLSYTLITIGAIVSFIAGIALQRLDYSAYLLAITIIITELLVVLPLPIYNKHPLAWQGVGL